MSEAYVEVLYDFSYHTEDGDEVKVKAGEELLLLRKTNENWWQVIRSTNDHPFYAPSNYLSIIGLNCKDVTESIDLNLNFISDELYKGTDNQNSMILKSKFDQKSTNLCEQYASMTNEAPLCNKQGDHFAFKNPLCSDEFLSYESESNICHKQVSGFNELNSSKNLDGQDVKSCDKWTSLDSESPIYMNISVSPNRSPPIPKAEQQPLRILPNDWYEYVDEDSSRKYYFHSVSGKVTWKPPRRHENMQSSSTEPDNLELSMSFHSVPEPPPKQLKPKLKKLAHSSNEKSDSVDSSCMFTILPSGWSQEYDSVTGTVYYFNEACKKRWFSSVDENGRTYFYDEDNSESVWELPDAPASSERKEPKVPKAVDKTFDSNSTESTSHVSRFSSESALVSPKLERKVPKLPVPRQFKTRSMVIPECVNLAGSEDKGFLPASFGEGYWPSVQDGHFSITRKGTLNKTKLVEGGKRIRKNWTSSFVVLTDVFLLFYKDIQSAHLASPGIKPELCIDLNGALIEWCPEKSSRKNVFQISTVLGHQLLLQDDNAQTTKEWFDTIQAAIMNLPSSFEQSESKHSQSEDFKKEVKLSRSKSTKPYLPKKSDIDENIIAIPVEKKKKIRNKLRQFFIRRPTVESLREKGILLDEPVFGCHLESLCIREGRKVPKFVSKCIEVIEKKELTADGLYRASGNLSQVQKIRIHVNQDDYSCLEEEQDVHVLTGALKMFFREMKEPLFPFNMFDKFLNAITLPDASSKLEALKELVLQMPESNYETLKTLLQHLLRVTKFHKQNRMQIQNLAIVFGPTLMCSEQMSSNIALDMMHQNRIVEFLLLEFDAIFASSSDIK